MKIERKIKYTAKLDFTVYVREGDTRAPRAVAEHHFENLFDKLSIRTYIRKEDVKEYRHVPCGHCGKLIFEDEAIQCFTHSFSKECWREFHQVTGNIPPGHFDKCHPELLFCKECLYELHCPKCTEHLRTIDFFKWLGVEQP